MSLGFGGLFPPGREQLFNFTFSDYVNDAAYLTFYGTFVRNGRTLYESFTTTPDSSEAISVADRTAQTFTVGATGSNQDFYPTEICFQVASGNDTTLILELQETTAGVPNGTVLARWYDDAITSEPIIANRYKCLVEDAAYMPNVLKLSASGVYALVFYEGGAGSVTIGYLDAGGYSGGSKYDSADSGANWTIHSGRDIYFEIYGATSNPYRLIHTSAGVPSDVLDSFRTFATTSASTLTSFGKFFFDLPFHNSVVIRGDAYLIVNSTATNIDYKQWTCTLYHVNSSGTETSLSSVSGIIGDVDCTFVLPISIQKFSSGEILRLCLDPKYIDDQNPARTFSDGLTLLHDPDTAANRLTLILPIKSEV